MQAVGFTGEKSARLEKQLRAKVELSGTQLEKNFIVVPKLVRECVLGLKFLSMTNTIIDIGQKSISMTMSGGSEQIQVDFNLISFVPDHRLTINIILDEYSKTLQDCCPSF